MQHRKTSDCARRCAGRFDLTPLEKIAKPERFPKITSPLFKLLLKTKVSNVYWDNQLKENGAYERRFARPSALESGKEKA